MKTLATVSVIAILAATPALALPSGGFGFTVWGASATANTTNIEAGTQWFAYEDARVNIDGSGVLGMINAGATVDVTDVMPIVAGFGPFDVITSGVTFRFLFDTQVALSPTTPSKAGAAAADYYGTVVDGEPGLPVGTLAVLSGSWDQVRLGGPINGSNTAWVQIVPIPEPKDVGVALLGAALLGFGLLGRRRA